MRGEVVYLYAFDVANEIVIRRVDSLLGQKPHRYQVLTDQTYPKDVPLYQPLAVEPPPLPTLLGGRPVRPLIRVYEVGVISVTFRVAVEFADLDALRPWHQPKLDNGSTLDQTARALCGQVRESIAAHMLNSSPPIDPEAYTVFCITEMEDVKDTAQWLARERRAVAGLLAETPADSLSESQVDEILRFQLSFESSDLAVIDWDAALIVDLKGYVDDVLFVLELANLQLEEFRAMDRILDNYLDKAYEDLDRRRFPLFGIGSGTLKKLRRFRVDLTKLADEVTHITKLIGDWYLARVYVGARERFYLDQWRKSIEDRLRQLDELYTVVHGDVNEQRMLWLEAIIVLLFLIDIFALFWGKG